MYVEKISGKNNFQDKKFKVKITLSSGGSESDEGGSDSLIGSSTLLLDDVVS